MCGAAFFPAGRGKGKNPRDGAKKRVYRLIPKILQNCLNEKYYSTYYDNNYKILL